MMDFCDLENFNPLVACLHQFDYDTNQLLITLVKRLISVSMLVFNRKTNECSNMTKNHNKMHETTEKLSVLS